MAFKKKDETKPEVKVDEVKQEDAAGAQNDNPALDPVTDEEKKALEAKLAEAQAKIAELEAAAQKATLVDEPDPEYYIIMHTRFKGDHVKLVNGKTIEFVNSYAKIPRSDKTSYELLKKSELWGTEYIEVNKMAVIPSGPVVQSGPLSTVRARPQGGN